MYLSLRKRLLAAANAVSNGVGDDVGARVRIRLALAIGLAVAIGATIIEIPSGQAAIYYVDVKNPGCSDASGFGSVAKPYCTLKYVSTIAVPGDTFLIQSGTYSQGPTVFTRSGTATAPITYRVVGDAVFATDVIDENFQPVAGMANVYSLPWTSSVGQVLQRRFAPILVDDPNQSIFTMVQEDGPLRLSAAPDDATLIAHEGMWRISGGILFVHAYGNRQPSTAGTDFMLGVAGVQGITIEAKTQYNIFDGFTIFSSFSISGANNKYLNIKMRTQTFSMRGSNNYAENLSVAHVIQRTASGKWLWHEAGQGTAAGAEGPGHTFKNIHLFHNWNSSLGTGTDAPGVVIDGARIHGAPNHCGVGGLSSGTVRNAIIYNCQDYVWLNDTNGTLIEHVTIPGGGFGIEGLTRPLGPVIVRNSIFSGSIVYIRGLDANCTWEKGSIMENNVISSTATIERCGPTPMTTYPILTYMAKCASGEFTGCMTIRNNRLVDPTAWKTVMKDGMWNATLGDSWDVTLVPNSPAIDAGTASGATRDILGVSRPKGSAPDIGAYEYCLSGCVRTPPSTPGQVRVLK